MTSARQPVVFTNIETARLRLRRFAEADLPAFIAYRNDPDVARYQSWEGISEAEAVALRARAAIDSSGRAR